MSELTMPEGWHWFEQPSDILRLGILEIDRPSSYFTNPGDALDRLWNILSPFKASYTICDCDDFDEAPEAEGWTDWDHTALSHQTVGRRLYDWLAWKHPGSTIAFRDEPDFQVTRPDGMLINGDIGRTSAGCFILSFLNLPPGSWWLSVQNDGSKHIIIVQCAEPA